MLPNRRSASDSGFDSSSIIWNRKLIGNSTILAMMLPPWKKGHRQLMDVATEALVLDALDHHQQDDGQRDGQGGVEVSRRHRLPVMQMQHMLR